MLYVRNLITKYFGDCTTDICLFVVYWAVCFVCVLCGFFLTSFMSDCCMTVFVDVRNDMHYAANSSISYRLVDLVWINRTQINE